MLDATIMSFGGDEAALEKLLLGLLSQGNPDGATQNPRQCERVTPVTNPPCKLW